MEIGKSDLIESKKVGLSKNDTFPVARNKNHAFTVSAKWRARRAYAPNTFLGVYAPEFFTRPTRPKVKLTRLRARRAFRAQMEKWRAQIFDAPNAPKFFDAPNVLNVLEKSWMVLM